MSERDIPLSKQLNVPPVWLVVTLLLIWLWDSVLPIVDFSGMLAKTVGALLMVGSMALAIFAIRQFMENDTPVHPRRKPETLLTTGLYARSRNPIYLAMIGLALGAALCFGSLGALIPVVALWWFLQSLFVEGEEHHIRAAFGEEWNAYADRTRRWL